MDDHKIGTYNFVAEPFHVDFTGKLTMGVLGNHLLNCAEKWKIIVRFLERISLYQLDLRSANPWAVQNINGAEKRSL